MNLRDLLTELRKNVLRDISTAVDGRVSDGALWDDDSLILYIRDAEEKFATGTLCLRDSISTEVSRVQLIAGEADYKLDKRVIAVYSAQLDRRVNLGRTTYSTRYGSVPNITPTAASYESQTTGEPRLFYTDKDSGYVGFHPAPSADNAGLEVRLQVARLPLNPLTRNDLNAEPEIPQEYHLDLLEWATWRALRNHDADIDGDPANIQIVMARASQHKKRFEDAVAECKRKIKYLTTQHTDFGVNSRW